MKLSIIVPVYKVEPYLRCCVDSILAQTFTDFELILVDDGSPDGCPAICDEYAQLDSRVHVVHQCNGGLSVARNVGLDIARGEYIGFVDSDDFVHPKMYERLIRAATLTNADIASCAYNEVYDLCAASSVCVEDNREDEIVLYDRKSFISNLFPDIYSVIGVSVWNKIYRRQIWEDLRFPVGRICEDWFVLLPCLCRSTYVAAVTDKLYYYYRRPGSITNSGFSIKLQQDTTAFCIGNLQQFTELGEWSQYQYQLDEYFTRYLRGYFAVKFAYPELNEDFKPLKKQANRYFWKFLICPRICKMGKVVLILVCVSPRLAFRVAKKYMPHYIFSYMR